MHGCCHTTCLAVALTVAAARQDLLLLSRVLCVGVRPKTRDETTKETRQIDFLKFCDLRPPLPFYPIHAAVDVGHTLKIRNVIAAGKFCVFTLSSVT